MKPIEIFAIDDKMNRATLTLPYKSLEWHRCYNECGDFTLEIPADIYDLSWRYIYTDDRPETGIIESVQLQDSGDAQKVDTIVLKGRFLESMMNRRVFLDEKVETITYTYEITPPVDPAEEITRPGLYQTEDGIYFWDTPNGTTQGAAGTPESGNYISASGIQTDENGQKYVTSGGTRYDVTDVNYMQQINSYYYQDQDNSGTVHRVQNIGGDLVDTSNEVILDDGFGNVYYEDSSTGTIKRAFGVVGKKEDTYFYEKKRYDATGGTVTVTQTVKGPWQRTEIDDVTVPADNVAKCVSYANRFFQNGMIFEEPEFTGTEKIIDPSLQYLGDLLYSELKQEGASFRVVYDFTLNQFVFSVWKGLDRTQSQTPVETEPEDPEWLTTGKVQSAEIETNPGSQVGKTIIYGASKPGESRLPEGYTELEYIESTGTQYIDTGFVPNNKTRTILDFEIGEISSTIGIFGTRQSSSGSYDDSYCLWGISGNKIRSDFAETRNQSFEVSVNVRHSVDKNGNATFLDGFEKVVASETSFESPETMVLFAVKSGTSVSNFSSFKFVSMKVYDDGLLARDYIPCKDKGGQAGLYDLANYEFYGNNGTGSFIVGPEIEIHDIPMSNVALSINGDKWSLDLGGKTLGDGQTLTVNRDGTANIDGTSIPSQMMPDFQSRNVSILTDSDLPHYFDMEYQKYQEPAQGLNPFYVFSDTWGTLYNYSVTEDESSYKNKCFVMYEYSGSDYTTEGLPDYVSTKDGKRGIITVRIEDDLSDRETYLDMRNESDALDDGESQTFMEYLEALYQKGKSYLATECGKIKELDTGDLTMSEYMNGFDLGDRVDMLVEYTGLIQEARIIEVSEVYKSEGPDIQITLGEAELKEV